MYYQYYVCEFKGNLIKYPQEVYEIRSSRFLTPEITEYESHDPETKLGRVLSINAMPATILNFDHKKKKKSQGYELCTRLILL